MILRAHRLDDVDAQLITVVNAIDKRASAELEIDTLVVFGKRSSEEQNALWSQGRSFNLEYVNNLRKEAKLPPITETENKHTVTDLIGGESAHNAEPKSKAVDLVGVFQGKADWNNQAYFKIVGEEAERAGMIWGGKWKRKDLGHIQTADWKKPKK